MSAMALLYVFLVTAVADEPNCLLQKADSELSVNRKHLQHSVKVDPVAPPGYELYCGPNCRCTQFNSDVFTGSPQACANRCEFFNAPGFIWSTRLQKDCRCCFNFEEVPDGNGWYLFGPPRPADVEGDPHITTLDGKHYTLLQQGSFSLWHLSGLETNFPSGKFTQTFPIDWQIFTHYSGHQSFTKGLLLVDKSGGSMRQVLEMTSQDCRWKARKGNEDWKAVNKAELIFVPNGPDYVTGFNLSSTSGESGDKFPNRVRFNMNTMQGKSDIAILSLSCRPGHNINLQIQMTRGTDRQFVDGEMKVARKSFSTMQMSTDSEFSAMEISTDSEFSVQDNWQELGGSEMAAMYLQQFDTGKASELLHMSCSPAEETQAKETCSKHLGGLVHGSADDSVFLKDCVFDLCHGAGETQAELTAELLETTRA
eukprot:Skav210526  [mRNA]  locus=scaffold3045:235245:236519:+ [translate_table: standard]